MYDDIVSQLLLLLVIIWLWANSDEKELRVQQNIDDVNNRGSPRHSYDDSIIASLKRKINHILLHLNFDLPRYRLVISNDNRTYVVNKEVIHLLVYNYHSQKWYDQRTLLRASLHEMSHILCSEQGHSSQFFLIEERLLRGAAYLGYLPKNFNPDQTYPCHQF